MSSLWTKGKRATRLFTLQFQLAWRTILECKYYYNYYSLVWEIIFPLADGIYNDDDLFAVFEVTKHYVHSAVGWTLGSFQAFTPNVSLTIEPESNWLIVLNLNYGYSSLTFSDMTLVIMKECLRLTPQSHLVCFDYIPRGCLKTFFVFPLYHSKNIRNILPKSKRM